MFCVYVMFGFLQDFFPEHMVSISSETNGIMNHSQLIQVTNFILCYFFFFTCISNIKVLIVKHQNQCFQLLMPL